MERLAKRRSIHIFDWASRLNPVLTDHYWSIGAGELPTLLMADRRVMFRSDQIGRGWLLPSATWVTCFPLAEETALKKFRELQPVSIPTTSLTRPTAMCTAHACGAPCSTPVNQGEPSAFAV